VTKYNITYLLFFLLPVLVCGQQSREPETNEPLTRILFVFDGSQSMYGRWQSGTKIDIAQRLIGKMLDSLNSINDEQTFQLALRVYGHQKPVPPQDCNDTRLEVPFSFNNIGKIKRKLREIKPKGTTPIARSLSRSATDFPRCDNCRNVVILITDGVEACDGDPCAVSRQLQKKGIILKPFVIGIGLDENFKETFACVGNYFDATDENTFENVLGIVISQALNNTTAQINLLDINIQPTETDVPITLYDRVSGEVKYSFVHTINYLGNPDTLTIDPLITYNMTVHTIPPVYVDSITLIPGKHTQIGASTPQGSLELKIPQSKGYKNVQAIVRRAGEVRTLNVQDFNTEQKYLIGFYDLEILTLPRYIERNVEINQSTRTRIAVPPPGIVSISASSSGYGSIFVERNNKLEWVIDLNPNQNRQSFALQPGDYRVVYRAKSSKQTVYSKSERFSISSGSSTIVKLN
jgi:Ca-activated chloride channel family protein